MQIIEKTVISSGLILAVMIIRALFQRKVSPAVIYALWIIVAIRLLLPGTFGVSALSVKNTELWKAGQEALLKENSRQREEEKERKYQEYLKQVTAGRIRQEPEPSGAGETEYLLGERQMVPTFFGKLLLWTARLWMTGMAFFSVIFFKRNFALYGYLRRTGTKLKEVSVGKRRISVYTAGDSLPSPCLFGLFPKIYIPERCFGEEGEKERIDFILEHELTHYRHGDFLWSLIRILCLIVAWYNPLVWIAARLSVRDGELACDRGCIKRLGREKRSAYGKALLAMFAPVKEREILPWHATMMTTGGKFVKKRIERIAGDGKNSRFAAALVVILMIFCAGSAFTGAEQTEERTANTAF